MQMLVVLLIFFASVSDKVYPEKGVILPNSKIEIFVTMFLLTYAADAIALLISSVVKTSSTANTFIPIILIVQIVFSGVLFDLGGFMDKLGNIMISKWGIGACKTKNWEQGWTSGDRLVGLPQNINGRPYVGGNAFLLQMHTMIKGYHVPVYMTSKQTLTFLCFCSL